MTNQFFKTLSFLLIIITSLSITACSEGERGFIPLPVEPEPELEEELFISASAVKGPWVNANISIYKFELDEGPIGEYNNALKAWFALLDANNVELNDNAQNGFVLLEPSESEVIANLKSKTSQYGYVSELKTLKENINEANNFAAAKQFVEAYIGLGSNETNSKVVNLVQDAFKDVATLSELKQKFESLNSLTDELKNLESFSAARGLLNEYRAKETNPVKLEGFTFALGELERLRIEAASFSVSAIRRDFKNNIYDTFLNGFALESDPVARANITSLYEKLKEASSSLSAKTYIEEALRKEGNQSVKASLSILNSKIKTLNHFKELVFSHEAFYHQYDLKDIILANNALATKIKEVEDAFQNNLEPALRSSLISEDKNVFDNSVNLLSFGSTNEKGVQDNLRIGEYRGFVYLRAEATNQTIDLNSGKRPILNTLETIFHTDEILGNGNNDQESRSINYFLNGEILKDSDGNIIKSIDDLEFTQTELQEILTVRPTFIATPLTQLALSLTIENLKNLSAIQKDSDLDSSPDYFINESTLKSGLKKSASIIKESFATSTSPEVDIFSTSPLRLAQMQFLSDLEVDAIYHRTMIENYSSILHDLMQITNLSSAELSLLLAKDLKDGQIDGQEFNTALTSLSSIAELEYLIKKDPSERLIPDTSVKVTETFFLMNEEFPITLPEQALNLFSTQFNELSFFGPKGGTDSDGDSILDNDDQFPNDATKSRNIEPGYAGIWSVNFDGSNTTYMPFNEEYSFSLSKEQIQGQCTSELCVGVGDLSTIVLDEYTLVSGPLNSDFSLTEQNDASVVGFTASATVPGDYLVKALLTTEVEPKQSYSFLIPIQVIDPKKIELHFEPANPAPGRAVSVKFKATKGICSLYNICSAIDLNDNVPDFLDISLLGDIFSVTQSVIRKGETRPYTEVRTSGSSVDLSNIELKDKVIANVHFTAKGREFMVGSNANAVGKEQDSDADGVSDLDDFFPNDGLCYLRDDGILDTNFDLSEDSLDTPICFERKIADASQSFDVNFLNEVWHYNPEWHYIIRETKIGSGFNGYINVPTLQGTKVNISLFKQDPLTKRIYFAYQNGVIDYFSFETQTVNTFVDSDAFSTVNSLNLLGKYLLVEYEAPNNLTEVKLYNPNGNIAKIGGSSVYPKPGESISLNIDNQNLKSATNDLLNVEWVIERVDNNQNIQQVPYQLSSDKLTLLSGQTAFKDVINLEFTFNDNGRPITFNRNLFVLGIDSISFSTNTFEASSPLILNLVGLNPVPEPDIELSFFVKWYKNDKTTNDFEFSLSEKRYPFIYEEFNFELGDMIRADFVLKHGQNELLIESLDAVILGSLEDLRPLVDSDKTVIDLPTRTVRYELLPPTENDEYFRSPFFVPVWYINGLPVEGENSTTFPTLASTTLKYGDVISASYRYQINGLNGESSLRTIGQVESNDETNVFELSKKVYEVGEDATLGDSFFSELIFSNLNAIWKINGVELVIEEPDTETSNEDGPVLFNELVLPSDKLAFGDRITLSLIAKGSNVNSAFDYVAEAFVGVNLEGFETPQPNNLVDLDSDNDGVPNYQDYFRYDSQCSIESEGNPDDIDNDGISDIAELSGLIKTNPNLRDTDGDGLSDSDELTVHFTDPLNPDSDGDGYWDGVEIDLGTSANNANEPNASLTDNDYDGLSNSEELIANTKVNVFDTDGDGLSDWYELNRSMTDPLSADSDGDNLSDGAEVRITLTNPNLIDSDNDSLSDGIEVALKLDPNSDDTDSNGILDRDESGYNFSIVLPKIFYEADLQDYKNDFRSLNIIPNGTCYRTWMANNIPTVIANTHNEQIDENSYQELAFTAENWSQVLRYNAQTKRFTTPINLDVNKAISVSSIEYDVNQSSLIYLGFTDGTVGLYDVATNTLSQRFDTGVTEPIVNIIDQGSFLITEQQYNSNTILHSFFEHASLSDSPINTVNSDFSYKNSIWSDKTTRQELISFDPDFSESSFIKQSFGGVGLISNTTRVELDLKLKAPLFLEDIASNMVLRFGSGHGVNLADSSVLSESTAPFTTGFEHERHRVISLLNSAFVQMTTLNDINNGFWQFNSQLDNADLVHLLPVGNHLLAITSDTSAADVDQHKIAFQTIILGDQNSDGLPDWWQNLSASLDVDDFTNYRLTNDAIIPDFLDGSPNIDDSILPPSLVDSDGDQICDHWELSIFNTNPLSADSDSDGMSDAQEVGLIATTLLDCGAYPTFSLRSDPNNPDSDGDGLLDGVEFFTHNTQLLNPDSDQDGLTDFQEITITFTNPLVPDPIERDSDSDGLTDAFELNESKTDHTLADSDGDGLNDFEEVVVFGTNPNSADSDGDLISDFDELNPSNTYGATDPSSVDSDADGLSDYDELDIAGIRGFKTNPNQVDTDQDGLTDFDEVNNSYEYSDDFILFLTENTNANRPLPLGTVKVKSDPNLKDTDGDGICDRWEVDLFNSNPAVLDTDGDFLNDAVELGIEIDPNSIVDCDNAPVSKPISTVTITDTDGDNIFDGHELNILFTDPKDKDSDDNGINDDLEDFDSDRLTNFQEIYQTKTDPFKSDSDEIVDSNGVVTTPGNGITDDLEDPDNDGLTSYDELYLYDTDPLKRDTDENGIPDGDEVARGLNPRSNDTDEDGLSDFEEIFNFDTDPLNPDTDNDGLKDGDEVTRRTNPKDPDTDNDLLKDGDDPAPLNSDFDGDGIIDGIEVLHLNTSPIKLDSDSDGLPDNYEVWLYAFEYDAANSVVTNTLLTAGATNNQVVNSKANLVAWPLPLAFVETSVDKQIFDIVDVSDSDEVIAKLYVHRYSDPSEADSDFDGLTDNTEFKIESVFGTNYNPDNIALGFDAYATNSVNFTVSDPWSADTNANGIPDAQEDVDNDFYINVLDQNDDDTDVTLYDTDSDSLPDGLEALLLDTSNSLMDTDLDGLNDQDELKLWSFREVGDTQECTDSETRVSNVAGKDYCFTVAYNSFPTLEDSDNDGVADRAINEADNSIVVDNYPLDPSCHLLSDGFVKSDQSIQCFSSWMSGFESIQIIEAIEWVQAGNPQANVLLYASGWENIIRFNLLTKTYSAPISVSGGLVDLAFNQANTTLYLLYDNASIESFNLNTGLRQTVGNYAIANHEVRQLLQINDSKLLLQQESDTGVFTSSLLDVTGGSPLSTSNGHNLDFSETVSLCINTTCSIYGFTKDANGENTNVGALELDTQTETFSSSIRLSNTLNSAQFIEGPIKLSQAKDLVLLGSGQALNPSLQDSDSAKDFSIEFNNKRYDSYFDFVNLNDHFIGIVDFDTQVRPESPAVSTTNNGTLVKDFSPAQINMNTYLLPPITLEEKVMKLLDFSNTNGLDAVYVTKFDGFMLIENLGIQDQDGDGMPSIYELVYGLDDSDPSDKFSDPDNDNLVNIEEYLFATDPQRQDTDADGWDDLYEVLNDTNPIDGLDF